MTNFAEDKLRDVLHMRIKEIEEKIKDEINLTIKAQRELYKLTGRRDEIRDLLQNIDEVLR